MKSIIERYFRKGKNRTRDNRYLVDNSVRDVSYELFICRCNNTEYQLIFSYFKDSNEVYVSVHLIPEKNIWKRIINSIKYIFGYRSKYGHFDEFIFSKSDADKLQEVVNYLKS